MRFFRQNSGPGNRRKRKYKKCLHSRLAEPLEDRRLLSCTVDVRTASGATSAVVTAAQKLTLQVWVDITGTDNPGTEDGFQEVWGSFLSTLTTVGGVDGNLSASLLAPFNAEASQAGTSQDLNGDGNLDVGSNSTTDSSGYFFPRADSMDFSGVVSGASQSFEVATLTYTVTSLGAGKATDITFRPGSVPDVPIAIWQQDGMPYGNIFGSNAGTVVGGPAFVITANVTTPTGSIAGSVDVGTTGLSEVTVYLDTNNDGSLDNGESSMTTSSAGAYDFTGLAAGSYTVRQVLPSGYTQTTPSGNAGLSITLTAGQTASGENFVDAAPVATGSIAGTVDVGTTGLSGVTVYLDTNKNGALDSGEPSTTTSSAGAYDFTGLAAGAYTVRQVLSSGYTQTSPSGNAGLSVTLTAGQSSTNDNFVDAAPVGTGSIAGTVKAGSTGLSGITVYLDNNNDKTLDDGEASTVSTSTGAYSFTGLSAGAYIVRQILPAGDTQTTPSGGLGIHITLASGQASSGNNFVDTVPASNNASIAGTVNAGSNGLAGITVYLDNNNDKTLDDGELSTVTTSTGSYSFTGLAAGAYLVRQILPAGDTQTSPTDNYGIHLTLASGQASTGNNFVDTVPTANTASISGTVKVGSTGLAGITVYLDNNNDKTLDDGELSTVTNSSGAYSFSGLAAGAYIVRQILPTGDAQTTPSAAWESTSPSLPAKPPPETISSTPSRPPPARSPVKFSTTPTATGNSTTAKPACRIGNFISI